MAPGSSLQTETWPVRSLAQGPLGGGWGQVTVGAVHGGGSSRRGCGQTETEGVPPGHPVPPGPSGAGEGPCGGVPQAGQTQVLVAGGRWRGDPAWDLPLGALWQPVGGVPADPQHQTLPRVRARHLQAHPWAFSLLCCPLSQVPGVLFIFWPPASSKDLRRRLRSVDGCRAPAHRKPCCIRREWRTRHSGWGSPCSSCQQGAPTGHLIMVWRVALPGPRW